MENEQTRETRFSGANGDREMFIFLVQLTIISMISKLCYICDNHTYYCACTDGRCFVDPYYLLHRTNANSSTQKEVEPVARTRKLSHEQNLK